MKIISLFSGCGGLDLGFTQAGHEIVWANDVWHDAVESYKLNLGNHITHYDVSEIDFSELPESEMIIGGFPCQGFSVANMKRTADDGRNRLYLEFLRAIKTTKPSYFLAENVKGILNLEGGKVFEQIRSDFASAGYEVQHSLLNAADFGVPQNRQRVFIFGVREGVPFAGHFPPEPTHSKNSDDLFEGELPKWIGVGDALSSIPEPDADHQLENHEASQYKLRFNGYLGHRTIDPEKPCPTITARGDDKGGVVIHHHPSNKRRLTAREAALIQSFPIDFKFFGTKTSIYRQVANAVPPLLAKRVAEAISSVAKNDATAIKTV